MTSVLLAAVVAASGPIKVAAPGLSAVSVSAELQAFVNDHLAQELVLEGVEVVTSSQIASVLGLERQKQLLGCSESGCVAELANALGVDAILLGTVAKLGAVIQLDVRVVSAADATGLALYSERVSSEAGLLDAMTRAAKSLAPQLAKATGRALKASSRPPTTTGPSVTLRERNTTVRELGKWMLIGGALAAAGGLIGLLAVINPNSSTLTDLEAGLAATMLAGLGVGAVGLILYLVGGTERVPVQAGFLPLPGGGGLATVGARF